MKYIMLLVLASMLSFGCLTDKGTIINEESCSTPGEIRCNDDAIQSCFIDYWGDIIDCSTLDGGTCCEVDGGPTCC